MEQGQTKTLRYANSSIVSEVEVSGGGMTITRAGKRKSISFADVAAVYVWTTAGTFTLTLASVTGDEVALGTAHLTKNASSEDVLAFRAAGREVLEALGLARSDLRVRLKPSPKLRNLMSIIFVALLVVLLAVFALSNTFDFRLYLAIAAVSVGLAYYWFPYSGSIGLSEMRNRLASPDLPFHKLLQSI